MNNKGLISKSYPKSQYTTLKPDNNQNNNMQSQYTRNLKNKTIRTKILIIRFGIISWVCRPILRCTLQTLQFL